METTFTLFNIDTILAGAVIVAVVLSFILLVVIFSAKHKRQSERIEELETLLKESDKKSAKLTKSLKELQSINASQEEEIRRLHQIEGLVESAREKAKQLKEAKRRLEAQQKRMMEMEEERKKLEMSLESMWEKLNNANIEIENLRRHNEHWVEQLSELRTKYESLKLRIRRHRL